MEITPITYSNNLVKFAFQRYDKYCPSANIFFEIKGSFYKCYNSNIFMGSALSRSLTRSPTPNSCAFYFVQLIFCCFVNLCARILAGCRWQFCGRHKVHLPLYSVYCMSCSSPSRSSVPLLVPFSSHSPTSNQPTRLPLPQ